MFWYRIVVQFWIGLAEIDVWYEIVGFRMWLGVWIESMILVNFDMCNCSW